MNYQNESIQLNYASELAGWTVLSAGVVFERWLAVWLESKYALTSLQEIKIYFWLWFNCGDCGDSNLICTLQRFLLATRRAGQASRQWRAHAHTGARHTGARYSRAEAIEPSQWSRGSRYPGNGYRRWEHTERESLSFEFLILQLQNCKLVDDQANGRSIPAGSSRNGRKPSNQAAQSEGIVRRHNRNNKSDDIVRRHRNNPAMRRLVSDVGRF